MVWHVYGRPDNAVGTITDGIQKIIKRKRGRAKKTCWRQLGMN